jgi:hypothetical protein
VPRGKSYSVRSALWCSTSDATARGKSPSKHDLLDPARPPGRAWAPCQCSAREVVTAPSAPVGCCGLLSRNSKSNMGSAIPEHWICSVDNDRRRPEEPCHEAHAAMGVHR